MDGRPIVRWAFLFPVPPGGHSLQETGVGELEPRERPHGGGGAVPQLSKAKAGRGFNFAHHQDDRPRYGKGNAQNVALSNLACFKCPNATEMRLTQGGASWTWNVELQGVFRVDAAEVQLA